jgi:hypothetical protein
LTPADPSAAFRQIENDAQTRTLELIPKYPIHRGDQSVREALELKRDAINSELLGVEHVRLGGAILGLGGSQGEGQFLAETRRHRRQ